MQMQCVKSVCIRSFCGPYFPALGLNTERGKIRTRKALNTDTSDSDMLYMFVSGW